MEKKRINHLVKQSEKTICYELQQNKEFHVLINTTCIYVIKYTLPLIPDLSPRKQTQWTERQDQAVGNTRSSVGPVSFH